MPPKLKLTPEEKKNVRLEKKAAKKQQQAERKKQIKRSQLNREIQYSSLTVNKYEKNWRKMLVDIALPNIRNDLEFAWHNFERVIDCKDFTISLLMDEIRDSEEQYLMNTKNHVEHIDKLINMFHGRVEEIQADNEDQITKLRRKCEEEFEQLNLQCDEEEKYLKTILYILDVAKKAQKHDIRAEYFSKIEEEETKNLQVIQRLKGILEKVHSALETDISTFLENYHIQVKERKKQHDLLKTRDESLQELMGIQLEKIRKACEYIISLRQQISDSQKLLGRKCTDLESEHDFFAYAFSTLKKRLISNRNTDFDKLKILTECYNDSFQYLKQLKENGERILHVAAVCRKLETQEEKILPFPTSVAKDMPKIMVDVVDEYIESLDFFCQRVAQADASRYAINEEREFLKTENKILKVKLHQYCQCFNCPAYEQQASQNVKYVTEGVLEMKKYDKQDYKQFLGTIGFLDEE